MCGALIARRILLQVKLMILLRIPPWSCLRNLGNDLLALGRELLRLYLLCYSPGDVRLFRRVGKDGRPIF